MLMNFFPKNVHQKQIDHLLEHRKLTLSGTGNLNAKAYFLSEVMANTDPGDLARAKEGINTMFWVIEEPDEAEKVYANYKFWSSVPMSTK